MKKAFSGFYSPSRRRVENAWKDEKTLFVFDTNVLLNLYSYSEEARSDFFKILDGISDKIWLPHYVGLEYQRNRLNVIKNEKYIFKKLNKYIEDIEKVVKSQTFNELKLDKSFPKLYKESIKLHENIQELLDVFKEVIKKQNDKQPDIRSGDKIRKKLEKYFNNKVGKPFLDQNELDRIYKDGEKRYENDIPPGYKDAKTKKDHKEFTYGGLNYLPKFGDLIIWKQIIEKAKNSEIKSILFITDDTKEDWWYIVDSGGKKRIGVRSELREEIEREAKISLFEVMTTSSFMEDGKKYLNLDVSEDSIEEVEEKSHRVIIKLDDMIKEKSNQYKMSTYDSNQLAKSIKYLNDIKKNELEMATKFLQQTINNNHYQEMIKKYQDDFKKKIAEINNLGLK